ncbi:MAG: amino acid ABC transporter substrate-binding protein, partial [Verrucomicrobiota bacterium]
MKYVFYVAASFWVVLLTSSCNEEPLDTAVKPLVVGMELAYPPFEMRGPDNEPDGISVRMAEDLAA